MSERIKNIATIQAGLFLLPLLATIWICAIFVGFVLVHTLLTTGHVSTTALMTYGFALAVYLFLGLPLTWLEWKLFKTCQKKYDIKDVSVNLIAFLFICGLTIVSLSNHFQSLPGIRELFFAQF